MITQRDWDLMQLEAQARIRKMYEEWQRQFLAGRIPQPTDEQLREAQQAQQLQEENRS